MVEHLLFIRDEANPLHGAVAALGSTEPSYTYTNHDFIEHMFEYLQQGENLELGSVIAYGNNKLVRDNGGSLPANVRMYVLFADPLLAPAIAPME